MNNQITSIPESVGGLENLTYLDLRNNRIGALPEAVGKLSRLSFLDLRNNLLVSLPASIANLPNLEKLDLRWNRLSSLPFMGCGSGEAGLCCVSLNPKAGSDQSLLNFVLAARWYMLKSSPMTITIQADHLTKTYQVSEREGGFGAAVRGFFNRKFNDVHAVQQVSFCIQPGEVVGFLGPNGAGKTTTLKMLSGLLHPTSGKAQRAGFYSLGAQARIPADHDPGDGPAQPPLLGYPRRRFVPAQPGHLPHPG